MMVTLLTFNYIRFKSNKKLHRFINIKKTIDIKKKIILIILIKINKKKIIKKKNKKKT